MVKIEKRSLRQFTPSLLTAVLALGTAGLAEAAVISVSEGFNWRFLLDA